MRLYPVFSPISRTALSIYYRFERAGPPLPATGPVLMVANHPNSLLDPAAVCAAAGRPVRFLAKAPLFDQRVIGFLVRSCGAIPVHRREDDPRLMDRNRDAFRAAYDALGAGEVVGIFPEGLSHDEPALTPLRTGAARIALGAARHLGGTFPIVPLGLVLVRKDRFRSRALVVVGEALAWDDLSGTDPADAAAVRELTERIEAGLRRVTLNLEAWEDGPVVSCAEAIYASERDLPPDPAARVERLARVSGALIRLRREDPEHLEPLFRAIRRFGELLEGLRLPIGELRERPPTWRMIALWVLRRWALFFLGAPLLAAAAIAFFVPYRLTGRLPDRAGASKDVRATYKLLGGFLLYTAWILLLSAAAAVWIEPAAGGVVFLGLPLLGLAALVLRDALAEAVEEARGWLLLRRHDDLRRRLLERRRELAERLEALRRDLEAREAREERRERKRGGRARAGS